MSDTLRHRILTALQQRLEAWSWSSIDIQEVYVGRVMFNPEVDPLPLITIVASVDESTPTAYKTNRRVMPIEVSALASLDDGATVTEDLEPAYGEIETAIWNGGHLQVGDDHFNIEFRGGGIADYPTETGAALVTIAVLIAIAYETPVGDPYNT